MFDFFFAGLNSDRCTNEIEEMSGSTVSKSSNLGVLVFRGGSLGCPHTIQIAWRCW